MDDYDLGRRIEVLVDRFLGGRLDGKLVLDAGCGVGGMTRALVARGARVIALDIGPNLAAEARARCGCPAVVGTLAATGFASDSFDVVLSSEAIEHTPDPRRSVLELYRLVKPGGDLVLSMPNRLWQAPVRVASALGLRPYDGYENFLWPSQLHGVLEAAGATVVEHRGIHLWPFQIKQLRPLLQRVDRLGATLLPLMINQCLHARKLVPAQPIGPPIGGAAGGVGRSLVSASSGQQRSTAALRPPLVLDSATLLVPEWIGLLPRHP
jgi:2-polyprenyl-6-hydroxyphenyl methylase/3-demethylubiquinone-9 3-methyltransferase